MFSILSVSIGITDKINAADLLCIQECRQTRDRTNGHLINSNTPQLSYAAHRLRVLYMLKQI